MDNNTLVYNRIRAAREILQKNSMDGMLVIKRENYFYLSGFTGTSAYVLITSNDLILITDSRYVRQAEKQASSYQISEYRGSIITELQHQIKKHRIEALGYEDLTMTCFNFQEIDSKLEGVRLLPLEDRLEKMRQKKDSCEIEMIQQAVNIADEAFISVLDKIRPGIKENEIAAEIEYVMKKKGALKPSFETIVASGKRSSLPHGVAGSKTIEPGDTVTLDFGCICNSYCSDMTRTVFVGRPPDEMKKIYSIVLQAQLEALEKARAGLTGRELDSFAREVISSHGFGDYFGHGLGHGLGLEVHEGPKVSPRSSIELDEGMVVTVEPGIYIPELGGVRIEDVIVIGKDKCDDLTGSTKELIIL